ncbi:MAG TPA: hypothetical protein PLL69_01960 [Gemmatimonadales bacterium]|nr:hypothetical protein [Gemmatimonadales bacterium]
MLIRLLLTTVAPILILGPPRIGVSTARLPANTSAVIEAHYHTDHDEARVYGTAYHWSGGQRIERPVVLEKATGDRWNLRTTWDTARSVVIVVGVEQGDHGVHGVAEALLRVANGGRVVAFDIAMTDPIIGRAMPRRVTDSEIEAAAERIGARNAE